MDFIQYLLNSLPLVIVLVIWAVTLEKKIARIRMLRLVETKEGRSPAVVTLKQLMNLDQIEGEVDEEGETESFRMGVVR